MFVTSDMCLYDIVAGKLTSIILIMDLNIENRKWVAIVAYQIVSDPFPLVDIAFVYVIVPLVAVQKSIAV
jgi:hypothetical protein